MPKLLQINSVVNTGSTGRIVEQIGQYARSEGWESFIAYGRKSNESKSKTLKIGNELDVNIHGLQSRLFDKHGQASVKATKKLLIEIEKINPDIIHLHNIHGYYLNYQILFEFLAKRNTPIIWTLHDCWPITGHCSFFSTIGCNKWKTVCFHCPQKKNYPTSLFIDNSRANYILKKQLFTSLHNLTIVPVSYWLEGVINESYLANYPLQVITNGVDCNHFIPISDTSKIRKKYELNNKFVLLGVGTNWDKRKGLTDYIKLSQILSEDYAIILVGLTEKQIKLLPPRIIGIKRTENIKELAEMYSSADIVLNLSSAESFGLTTVEGFACGTPGIVYNCTASPELIIPTTGIIIEPGNIELLIKAIEKIKLFGKKSYTTSCRNRAIVNYNNKDRFNEYIQLYKKLINQQV